tara:strand:+ start:152373 stop:152663 length:291 start_codon:yes stop_codon:yes gene_type:complete
MMVKRINRLLQSEVCHFLWRGPSQLKSHNGRGQHKVCGGWQGFEVPMPGYGRYEDNLEACQFGSVHGGQASAPIIENSASPRTGGMKLILERTYHG